MIYIIKGRQRKGKTTVAVGLCLHLVTRGFGFGDDYRQYDVSDIVSNFRLYKPDGSELETYHYVTSKQMRLFMRKMVEQGISNKIILIDEIDRVFSHRFWQKNEQSETLLGLWQDEKLQNIVIGTCHVGRSIDLLIRQCMHALFMVKQDKVRQTIRIININVADRQISTWLMRNVRTIQTLFKTREPVV